MKFSHLQHRVARAEAVVAGRKAQMSEHFGDLGHAWRSVWSPFRIVTAGLVFGFLSGRAEPTRAVNATRWLQLVSTVSGLISSVQAAVAASMAGNAASSADNAAVSATEAAGVTGQVAQQVARAPFAAAGVGATPADGWGNQPPRPAEAATEMSER